MYKNFTKLTDVLRGYSQQFMRVMRITAFLMLLCLLQLSAKTNAQLISLSGEKMPLMEVLKEIHRQSGVDFIFAASSLKYAHPVTVDIHETPLNEALRQVFAGQPLAYEIADGAVTVWGKTPRLSDNPDDNTSPAIAYDEIRGRVVDSLGKGLPSVTIRVKGAEIATKTDQSGYFVLYKVPADAMIEITSLGYKPYAVRANSLPDPVVFVLKQATSTLDEAVVQAYGTTTRRFNTGNIARISAADIETQPVANPLAALQGRVPGMLVTQTSGIPGAAVNIEIRGRTAIDKSITSDQPLFVIDGVPYSNGNKSLEMGNWSASTPSLQIQSMVKGGISPFQGINPQDIESIEVLKDADATAIYGSRGANGVILISTKRGKAGKASFSINSYQGISFVPDNVKMMDTRQYIAARKQAFKNSGIAMTTANAPDILVWDTTRNYNYAKMFTDNIANTHSSQLSLTGGNRLTQFSLRGGYNRENTIMDPDHKSERINVSFSLNQKSTNEKLNVLFSGSFGNSVTEMINQDMSRFRIMAPNMRMLDDQGKPLWEEYNYTVFNPFAELLKKNNFTSKTLYGNIQPSYRFNEHLKISANIGYNLSINDQDAIVPLTSLKPGPTLKSSRVLSNSRNQNLSIEPQLDYGRQLFGGDLNILFGGTYQSTNTSGTRIDAQNFPSDEALRLLNNALSYSVYETASQYKYIAAFGRVNYNFHNTYIANFTARRDGSSRFGAGKRFSNFGAAGLAWIFTNQFDLKDKLPWLSFGKLRGSLGITGNDKIPDYQYLDTWAVNNYFRYPSLNDQFLYPDKLYNPSYHWESTRKTELALEFGLFNDRVLFSPVYFRNISSNQLVNYKLPKMTGFNEVVANLPATVVNDGFEFTLSSDNIKRKDFSWHTDVNFSVPRNKLKAFPDIENSSYYTTYVVGKPLNVIYLLDFLGVNPETGDPMFLDVNKDGLLNTDDYVPTGTLDPKFYGGIQNTFTYKNFRLDFFFLFRNTMGGNYLRFAPSGQGDYVNWPVVDDKVWEKPGDIVSRPKLLAVNTTEVQNFRRYSNAIYSNASYIRLNNASLSYTLPERITGKAGISTLRVYILGQNLWTITKYKVGDPEIQSYLSTPSLCTITGGFQLTF
ncbi:SusC/RagA family TonB-linked outer membrane protein [Chitinophaga defluvii]|uniref:SusC/RagA family TonB-linked outer membrane protein n=1 Tax=Chitinophaga defluvii TaxID=3163343 RepID=A0ABV2TBU0_9BACT